MDIFLGEYARIGKRNIPNFMEAPVSTFPIIIVIRGSEKLNCILDIMPFDSFCLLSPSIYSYRLYLLLSARDESTSIHRIQ